MCPNLRTKTTISTICCFKNVGVQETPRYNKMILNFLVVNVTIWAIKFWNTCKKCLKVFVLTTITGEILSNNYVSSWRANSD